MVECFSPMVCGNFVIGKYWLYFYECNPFDAVFFWENIRYIRCFWSLKSKSFSGKILANLFNIINAIAADGLETRWARASTTLKLKSFSVTIPVSATEQLILITFLEHHHQNASRWFLVLFHYYGLTSVSAWISIYMAPSNVWDEITYQYTNYNRFVFEVWEWISNFIPHFKIYLITYQRWD